MSTETPTVTTPVTATPETPSTPSTPASTPNADPAIVDPAKPADPATKPAEGTKPGDKPAEKPADEGDLLFGKKPEGDGKDAAKPQKPDATGQRDYLKGKVDPKELEGKSDADIEKMFDAEQEKEAAADPSKQAFKFEELKIPAEMPVPEDMKGKVKDLADIFNDSKLTNTQKMQKAVDLHIEMVQKQTEQWATVKKTWRDECSKDPVIGGDKLKPAVAATERTVLQFAGNPDFGGSPELMREVQEDLVLLGLGNKRSFIKMMANIAKATGEDKFEGSAGGGSPPQQSLASKMWPDMPGDKK